MIDISITQKHELSHPHAKAAAQRVADKMTAEYGMDSEWDGDVLICKRSGASAKLSIYETEAQLEITLGVLFKMFASTIEETATQNMRKLFGSRI
jgi:putative polyhydroxyalkanoate system protein